MDLASSCILSLGFKISLSISTIHMIHIHNVIHQPSQQMPPALQDRFAQTLEIQPVLVAANTHRTGFVPGVEKS